jgi:hypothetical protein
MPTQFACPSPRGTNGAGLYLTRAGHLVDKHGNHWGRSSMKMALDAALATPMSTGPKKPQNPLASQARSDHAAALKKVADVLGLPEEVMDRIKTIIEEAERVQIQEYAASLGGGKGAGKGAIDKSKAATDDDDEDDDASVERRVRELLSSKGLDSETIEEALKRVRADREAARDSRPQPATRGGFGGRFSGATKDDIESEYGGEHLLDLPDYSPDPNRGEPGYNPAVYRAGLAAARELPGGGVSRRLSNDRALEASDEQMAKDYPGIENVIAGY